MREFLAVFSATLIFSSFVYIEHAHAQRDPDEIKMSCTIPTGQIAKGLATLARQEAELAGYEKVRARIKLKRLDPADRDTFYAEDYIKKVGLNGDGLNLTIKPKLKVKLEPCSQFFNVTITVTALSADGRKVTGTATTEDVEMNGFYQ